VLTRYLTAVIYEPDQGLAIAFGGRSATGYVDSAMRLDLVGGFFLDAGGANGTVVADKWCYGPGETATLTPTPANGYVFHQWLRDASGTDNPLSLTVDSYKVVEAEFVVPNVAVEEPALVYALGEIRPNPSPGPIELEYSLPEASRVRLGVYDLAGRRVGLLVDGVHRAGRHRATWDGRLGVSAASSGLYFVRFETPAGTWVRRVVLIR
jgi:hypothetical protein